MDIATFDPWCPGSTEDNPWTSVYRANYSFLYASRRVFIFPQMLDIILPKYV